jgi:energy-coupling factor transporter transmembrane protein EcfT
LEAATLLFIILAVIIALFIAVFQYFFKNKEKIQLNYWLSFFRFLSIFLILLLLINPSIKNKTTQIIKPNLLVAIDNSSSIKFNSNENKVKSILNLVKNDTELNNKFTINYYTFGQNLEQLDSLSFLEKQTNLSKPIQQFSKIYKRGINPVLIISDGNQTIGNTVEFINYKSPVFSFIVGDTTVLEDIYIHQINVNKYTNIKNKFPVELFVNYSGSKAISKQLTIYHEGITIFSKHLSFSKTENAITESFYLTASRKGTQFYTAAIEQLKDEQNTINNNKNFSINVIEEKAKILILNSVLHPDLGMLKKSIESNKQRSVSIVNSTSFKGNLSDYQLVILYQPTTDFNKIWTQVNAKKINYFIITGLNTDWNFLNSAQDNFNKNAISETENYNPIFNFSYVSFINNEIDFTNFPPLTDKFGNTSFKVPYNTLLFKKIGTFNTNKPLLATFELETRKGAVLFGENLWRWRMSSFTNTQSFESFDGFISNLIQYLSSIKKNKRLNISAKTFYYTNETIEVSASYLDKNFNFDNRAKLWLTISNSENNFSKKIPFGLSGKRYIAELSNISHGTYKYNVSVENSNESAFGSFRVLPFEVEQQFTSANKHGLQLLANKTKGNTYYNNQEHKLLDDLNRDGRFKSIQKTKIVRTALINWKWILGVILLSLSIEWFARKYVGKI